MRRALSAYLGWWEAEIPVSRYVPLRIGVGLLFVIQYLTLIPIARLQFDSVGLSTRWVGGTWGHVHWSALDNITGLQTYGVIAAGIVGSVALAAGVFPRIGGTVAFVLQVLLLHRSNYWQDGSDCLIRCVVFFMCFAKLSGPGLTGIWPLRLVRIQIAVLYLATAIWKEVGSDWPNGSALYWVLQDPRYQRISLDWALSTQLGQWVATAGTWGTLWVEFALAVLLMDPSRRKWALLVGVALHLGIWATMRIGLFSPMMLVSYLAFVERGEDGRWRVSTD